LGREVERERNKIGNIKQQEDHEQEQQKLT
jgi:hypothetical protein